MYFCEIENFAYGEINERNFSNPHPWPVEGLVLLIAVKSLLVGGYFVT